jgi:thiol-disulfide isomerase/thioredoxin
MKTLYKIWFTLLLLACMNETSLAQTNVSISGKLNYQEEGTINIDNDSFGVFTSTMATTDVNKSGDFQFKFSITKPQVVRLFNRPFYISPGDSVFANASGGSLYYPQKLDFKGRNADPYIYAMKYDSLKIALNYKFFEYDFKDKPIRYLELLNANKKILLDNLDDFSKSHALSDDFKAYYLNQILYAYYGQLLSPLSNNKYPMEDVPPAYSAIIDQIKLNQDNMVDKEEYESTAIQLINYKKKKSNGNDLQLIQDNATGLTKEFLMTHYANVLISSYSPKDSLVTKELFEKIDAGVINSEIRKYFILSKDRLNKYLTPFPKEVLLTALMDSVGHKLTFKDLLTKSKNKIIVFDFWASWCGPCRVGMPKVNKLKKDLNNPEVVFVFISIDDTESEWRGGLKNTKIPGNHYWIADKSKSALAKYLEIRSIPRYVIINKTGKIERFKAWGPEPGEYGIMSQLTGLLSL